MALELDLIAELGGDKSDLDLLKGLSDDEEEVLDDLDKDLEADPINRDQLREFIKELGIKKYRDEENDSKKKEKKKKLIEIQTAEEEEVEKEEGNKQEKEKKKKKKKNKLQHNEVSSTSTPDPERNQEVRVHIQKYQARNYLLMKSGQRWFEDEANHKIPLTGPKPDLDVEHEMETFASKLLQDEVSVYIKQREKSKKSEVGWLKTVLTSGTLTDKMAALTLLVQESPVHNLNSLDSLIGMVKKKGRRESMMAADTVKELFLSYLLPDRKLRLFTQNPLLGGVKVSSGNKDILDKRLLLWGFEEKLKTKYTAFIQALDTLSHDTLPATKQKALSAIFDLLVSKSEQEKTLLTMLVNKVGDPDYKLASKASHYLTRLVDKHPNMKTVVTEEVERLLYRPNVPSKAQYYCICFLNQLLLSQEEKKLASKLINMYFSYFKAFVKKGEVESKMMSALLSGVNRAYPYAKVDSEYIHGQMDTLYKIVHIVNFNTSIQALMLLYQVMDSSESVSDRYYTALYKKMTDPALKSSAKQAMFLNLLFKSMRKDLSERRVKAFIKRLLQICSYQTPQFTCGALVLLGEVLKSKPTLIITKHKAQVDSDDEEEHFTDVVDPEEKTDTPSSDSEDEHKESRETIKTKPSWVHKTNLDGGHDVKSYDAFHRNPLYCHADDECIWELEKMAHHFHPSVSLFAQSVLKGEPISYSSDPLKDFTTIRFLDRFAFKNPKKKENLPKLNATISKVNMGYPKGIKRIPVNSEKYLARGEESIPVEEKFYYQYFTQKAELENKDKDVQLSDEDSDAESISDSEFDAYLDKYEDQFDQDDVDFDDTDMDFSRAFGSKKGQKKKRSDGDDSDEDSEIGDDDDDDDVDDDLSDEEVDFGDDFDEQFKDFDDDDSMMESKDNEFDEEEIAFSDNDDEYMMSAKNSKKRKGDKLQSEKGNKKSKEGGMGLFAAAEEFSHLIDENQGSKFDMTGINAMSNKDKASAKQLKWEIDRDRKFKGQSWKNKKSRNSKFQGKPKWKGKKTVKPKGKKK